MHRNTVNTALRMAIQVTLIIKTKHRRSRVCQDLQDDQFYSTKRQYFKETKHREVTNTCLIERMFITCKFDKTLH